MFESNHLKLNNEKCHLHLFDYMYEVMYWPNSNMGKQGIKAF